MALHQWNGRRCCKSPSSKYLFLILFPTTQNDAKCQKFPELIIFKYEQLFLNPFLRGKHWEHKSTAPWSGQKQWQCLSPHLFCSRLTAAHICAVQKHGRCKQALFYLIFFCSCSGLKIIEEDSTNSGSLYGSHQGNFDSSTLIFSWFGEFLLLQFVPGAGLIL